MREVCTHSPSGRRPRDICRSRTVQPEDTRENQGTLQSGSSRIRRPGARPGDTRAKCGRGGEEVRDGDRGREGDAEAPGVRLRAARLRLDDRLLPGRQLRRRRWRPVRPVHHRHQRCRPERPGRPGLDDGQAPLRLRHPPDPAQLLGSRPAGDGRSGPEGSGRVRLLRLERVLRRRRLRRRLDHSPHPRGLRRAQLGLGPPHPPDRPAEHADHRDHPPVAQPHRLPGDLHGRYGGLASARPLGLAHVRKRPQVRVRLVRPEVRLGRHAAPRGHRRLASAPAFPPSRPAASSCSDRCSTSGCPATGRPWTATARPDRPANSYNDLQTILGTVGAERQHRPGRLRRQRLVRQEHRPAPRHHHPVRPPHLPGQHLRLRAPGARWA